MMDAATLAAIWCAIGAALYVMILDAQDPWWLIAGCVLSWPLFALQYFTGLEIELAWYTDSDAFDE